MKLGPKAQKIADQVSVPDTKLGDLRKIANEIKKDHELALELWSVHGFMARQLAILIMDKKLLTQEVIDQLVGDIQSHIYDERNHLIDWLMANQLMKEKKDHRIDRVVGGPFFIAAQKGLLVLSR